MDFAEFISLAERGKLHVDLTEQLHEIGSSLASYRQDHGGAPEATMTIKFKFKLDGDGLLSHAADVQTKTPKNPRFKSVCWLDQGGRMHAADPRQQSLFEGGQSPRTV